MVNQNSSLTMKCFILLFVLTICCVNVQTQLPQNPGQGLPPPSTPATPNQPEYESPVLQGGVGIVSDGKEADVKRRRYPDRSGSYSQAYDPGLAFRGEQGPEPQTPVVRQQDQQQPPVQQQQQLPPVSQQKTFPYDPYPVRNATNDNVLTRQILAPVNQVIISVLTYSIPVLNDSISSRLHQSFFFDRC